MSELRCRPGDLAVMVKSEAGNVGKIVTCVRLANDSDLLPYGYQTCGIPHWVVDRDIPAINGRPCPFVADMYLRPLRPGEGEDEMLTIVGKPEGVAV